MPRTEAMVNRHATLCSLLSDPNTQFTWIRSTVSTNWECYHSKQSLTIQTWDSQFTEQAFFLSCHQARKGRKYKLYYSAVSQILTKITAPPHWYYLRVCVLKKPTDFSNESHLAYQWYLRVDPMPSSRCPTQNKLYGVLGDYYFVSHIALFGDFFF